MSQFLTDYHLFEDLTRLNNQEYFQSTFDIPESLQFFTEITNQQQFGHHRKILKIFLVNLKRCGKKTVFVVIKWLIAIHKIIKVVKCRILFQSICSSLTMIEQPLNASKSDQYFREVIFKPYLHFLIKLCNINIHSSENTSGSNEQNKQNISGLQNNIFYLKFNLLRYCSRQLCPSLIENHGFFSEYFPFLNSVNSLLKEDLNSWLQELRISVKKQLINGIQQKQLLTLEKSISAISNENQFQTQEQFLSEANAFSQKFIHFMNSGVKAEDRTFSFDLNQ